MIRRAFWVGLLAAVGLAGCNFNMNLPTEDPKLNALADRQYRDVVAGRDDLILARMSSETDPATVKAQLPFIRTVTPKDEPPKPEVVGYQSITSTSGRRYIVRQNYGYADRTAAVETNFLAEDGVWKVSSFNVNVTLNGPPPAATPKAEKLIPVV